MTTNNNSNVTVNSLYGKHGNMRSCNGFDCSLHEKYSKEEAASVLSGDIHLEEIVVIRPRTELGFRIWKAEETILAWLGDHGNFVVADASYSKDQLKSHLNGGWYFSGHRGGSVPDGIAKSRTLLVHPHGGLTYLLRTMVPSLLAIWVMTLSLASCKKNNLFPSKHLVSRVFILHLLQTTKTSTDFIHKILYILSFIFIIQAQIKL